jgi:hypothetical protein
MPKHEGEPLVRKHVILYQSDWEKIEHYFLPRKIGASYAIRKIVRAFFIQSEATAAAKAKRLDPVTDLGKIDPSFDPSEGQN